MVDLWGVGDLKINLRGREGRLQSIGQNWPLQFCSVCTVILLSELEFQRQMPSFAEVCRGSNFYDTRPLRGTTQYVSENP